MKAIGGYFELADREAESGYPVDGVRLNTSRNALEYIIKSIPDVRHIYLPLYTCEAVIQPFKRLHNIKINGNLRSRLIENKIFVDRYWPNVLDWC